MLKKILKKPLNLNRNFFALFFMMTISFGSQILSLVKSSVIADNFGLSNEIDAYNLVNSISAFFVSFISSGIVTIIVPGYIQKKRREYLDSFITLIYFALFIIVAVFLTFRSYIIGFITNKSIDFVVLACNMLLVVLTTNYLFSITNITTAYFQSREKFNIPKLTNFSVQFIVIVVLLSLKKLTIIKLVICISCGLIINTLLDVVLACCEGWRFKPSFMFLSQETKRLFRTFIPVLISSGIYQISLLIDTLIASNLETGKITVLNYSGQIVNIVNTVVIGNLLVYIYPKIIKSIQNLDKQQFFWDATIFFHFVVCFIITVFAAIGKETITFLFQRGNFNESATQAVFFGALIYIFGQQTNI